VLVQSSAEQKSRSNRCLHVFVCVVVVVVANRFISDHGGHTNAFTAAEDTNYQFDVNWDALPEALDRCAAADLELDCDCMQRYKVAQQLLQQKQQDRWQQL
jgi:predicted Zn-dependent peptidase